MGRDLKRKGDPRGPHIRLYARLYDSAAWRALSFSAQALWLAMRRDLNGGNNGRITATLGVLAHRGFKSSATIARDLRELEVAGFIAKVRQGGIAAGGKKVTNLWRFTDEGVVRADGDACVPAIATNDWQEWKKVEDVERAILQRHAQAKRPSGSGNAKLQNLKRAASEIESEDSRFDSVSEHGAARTGSESESERNEPQHPRPAPLLAIRQVQSTRA